MAFSGRLLGLLPTTSAAIANVECKFTLFIHFYILNKITTHIKQEKRNRATSHFIKFKQWHEKNIAIYFALLSKLSKAIPVVSSKPAITSDILTQYTVRSEYERKLYS